MSLVAKYTCAKCGISIRPGIFFYYDSKGRYFEFCSKECREKYQYMDIALMRPSPEKTLYQTLRDLGVPQRQDSLTAQLIDVIMYANLLGCYDAADVIKGLLERKSNEG